MRAVVFTGSGGNEVVEVEERPDPTPGEDEIVVAVTYAGLNPADLGQRHGRYPAPPGSPDDIPGLEVAGVVERVGAAVTEWREGDAVFGIIGGGGLADRVRVHRRHVTAIPEGLPEMLAAATPEAFITAHDALRTQARMGLGDVVLVRGANGGVGTAALQIALAAGATPLGVARSPEGRETITALGAQALSPDEADALDSEVDVVLELVGGPHLDADIRALRRHGRIVVIGVSAGRQSTMTLFPLLARHASIMGSTLRARNLEDKALAVRTFAHEVVPSLAEGRMRPVVDRVFPIDDIRDAFDHLEHGSKRGRILVEF